MAASRDNELDFDLGLLSASDLAPVDISACKGNATEVETVLHKTSTHNAQLLFDRLFALEKVSGKSVVKLPEPITKLPRQKPAPAPKVETKWDKYAKDKGIQNKKRDRMVWDEDSKTWKPRWGYKAMTDTDEKNWIIEYKQKDDHTADMFEKRREDKKLRVLKNQKQQVNNKLRGPDGLVPQSADLLPAGAAATLTQGKLKRSEQEGNPKDTRAKGGLGKKRTLEAIKQTQVSTASLGRFDDKMKGEGKRPAPPVKGKKRIGGPNERMDDVARDKSILDRVLGKLPSRGSHSHGIDLEDPAYQVGTNKRKKGRR